MEGNQIYIKFWFGLDKFDLLKIKFGLFWLKLFWFGQVCCGLLRFGLDWSP